MGSRQLYETCHVCGFPEMQIYEETFITTWHCPCCHMNDYDFDGSAYREIEKETMRQFPNLSGDELEDKIHERVKAWAEDEAGEKYIPKGEEKAKGQLKAWMYLQVQDLHQRDAVQYNGLANTMYGSDDEYYRALTELVFNPERSWW
jgi:hypothetical protein